MFTEQFEELTSRLNNCLNLVYTSRPKEFENNVDNFLNSLHEHTGEPTMYYTTAVVDTPGGFELFAALLDSREHKVLIYKLRVRVALSIMCNNCHEIHYHELTPITAAFTDESRAFALAGKLNEVLND